jgi:hypothetical protein
MSGQRTRIWSRLPHWYLLPEPENSNDIFCSVQVRAVPGLRLKKNQGFLLKKLLIKKTGLFAPVFLKLPVFGHAVF